MEPIEHLAAVEHASGRLLTAAAGSLGLPVGSCPGWDVGDLVGHIGRVWGWAASIVESDEAAGSPEAPARTDEPAYLGWARDQADRLLGALGSADPDAGCWTLAGDGTRRFWFRRQALESALHAWDAEGARGEPAPIDPALAGDGVDEFVTVMLPRWASRHPGVWHGESLHLHRTDGEGEWLVAIGPGDRVEAARAHGKGDVALRGDAASLWLWCTSRRALDELGIEVFGDRSVAERWNAEIAF